MIEGLKGQINPDNGNAEIVVGSNVLAIGYLAPAFFEDGDGYTYVVFSYYYMGDLPDSKLGKLLKISVVEE